uniref:Uncharacterized protein n=1 Tax=Tanacetum cinerariifolium TaxID=118510 RepID=A0A699PXB1_TANCI|nr:hypothetical protein [Tanacetum cinerariifolium]
MAYPTSEGDMKEQPDWDMSNYKPAGKLTGKVALITGGDSGPRPQVPGYSSRCTVGHRVPRGRASHPRRAWRLQHFGEQCRVPAGLRALRNHSGGEHSPHLRYQYQGIHLYGTGRHPVPERRRRHH